jgi:cation transport ATPase
MPKAAAIQPNEWATIHDNFEPFDLGALNRVVLDYAHIELANAKRWTRRSALGRACAAIVSCLKVLGLMAAVSLALFLLAGVDGEALVALVYSCATLSCAGVLGFFVPWLLTPYRQWDRTLSGISVMVAVAALLALGAACFRTFEAAPAWVLAPPCLLVLLVAVGALVGDYRLSTTAKPPAVDLESLSPQEIEVLIAARHRALRILRSRNVVSYKDFHGFDSSPLTAPGGAGK